MQSRSGRFSVRSWKLQSLFMAVGSFRGQFQFVVHLVEKFLGLGRVAVHVPFVGLLRGGDFLPRLAREVLRRSKVRMFVAADVVLRHLGYSQTTADECERKYGAQGHSRFCHISRSPYFLIEYPPRSK